jgi:dihydropteroate synthase
MVASPTYAPMAWDTLSLEWGKHTHIMGIVNITPDSFADDGLAEAGDPDEWAARAAAQGARMVAEGAAILDVGGASSRPGAAPVPAEIERTRVVPALHALRAAVPANLPIAIDTTSATVARAALDAGANMINDISGLQFDPDLAPLAAEYGVPVVIMANMRGQVRREIISDTTRYLARGIERALAAGVAWEHIILDPGFGFGPTPAENMTLIRHLDALLTLGRPILLGVSRKSTLGRLLGNAPVADRLEASLAAAVAGVLHGAAIVRVHDVAATARALAVADALRYGMPA